MLHQTVKATWRWQIQMEKKKEIWISGEENCLTDKEVSKHLNSRNKKTAPPTPPHFHPDMTFVTDWASNSKYVQICLSTYPFTYLFISGSLSTFCWKNQLWNGQNNELLNIPSMRANSFFVFCVAGKNATLVNQPILCSVMTSTDEKKNLCIIMKQPLVQMPVFDDMTGQKERRV